MTVYKRANEQGSVGFCSCKLREEIGDEGKMTAWKRAESGGLADSVRAKK